VPHVGDVRRYSTLLSVLAYYYLAFQLASKLSEWERERLRRSSAHCWLQPDVIGGRPNEYANKHLFLVRSLANE
jgi:hypothetical protein